MNREELINIGKSLTYIHACPTFATDDMGYQYDFVCSEGVGTEFGGMGNWPIFKISSISNDVYSKVRKSIEDKTITCKDLEGTSIGNFIGNVMDFSEVEKENDINLSEYLAGFLSLPEDFEGDIFIFIDLYSGESPLFFDSLKSVSQKFFAEYSNNITPWEDIEDDELEDWISRLKEDLSDLAYIEV